MKKIHLFFFIIFTFSNLFAQESIPIYHDYLSDNLFLLHPSTAGASSCSKIRLTGRMQWFDVADSPMLQTFSFNTYLGEETNNGIGLIIFNDRNGYHSQKGLQLAYAHHLNFGNGAYINKLSFGLAGTLVQNQLDETSFDPGRFDPIISGIIQSDMYYNFDFGMSYHLKGFFMNATLKNALIASRGLYTGYETVNLRNIVVSTGFYTNSGQIHLEPSILVQYKDFNGQLITDGNLKVYFDMQTDNNFYLGISYRKDWLININQNVYQTITPIAGIKLNHFIAAYTYTYGFNHVSISNSGFHQITIGYNFNCRQQLVKMACPEIN
ncbi:MAG TPA: type IX secretion system membrane protein PorP/SprF [Flavobacteriales bacterium]|nr:type IX secretion system membrane protein PorP/SprF [Flavobacteriales bacterium]